MRFSLSGIELDELRKRLKIGMLVRCRIIEKVGDKRFVLRLKGHNILIEANQNFNVGDELVLKLKEKFPRMVFVDVNRETFDRVVFDKGKLVVY
ncbi:MAG: hypothetical protein DRP92_00890 [Candidatus Neomarinimicrobiota bacterium]|nr:hypothetical protein [Candidatus Neomarinimicrobiota bacterium]RKY48444.1 MAG: hypothetical protein DRP88_02105 [Candidatus Neomarinimicrobiota bacterium]RKY54491.1 MAG: hypothetical protein DRP92_00890 [Candidatus Neomarinimicrobiota bacterium]